MGNKTGWLRSATNGRIAGHGCIEDDYSDESGCKPWIKRNFAKDAGVRFVNDKFPPESLNGPVIIVQEGRKKDGK